MGQKNVVFTRLTVFNNQLEMYDGIETLFRNLNKEGHNIIVVSHKKDSLIHMKSIFEKIFEFKVICGFRKNLRGVVKEENAKDFILVGSSDDDLVLAANKKILIINPGWSVVQDEKPFRYGITLNEPIQLFEAIRLIANQNRWYFELEVDQHSTVLALTSANTLNRDVGKTEREILEGFENLLKAGDRKYFNTLYFHLISGVMKSAELRDVDIWGTFPSSSGSVNEELEELKERCRYLTGKKMKEPLFIRHSAVKKSHHTSHGKRIQEGCKKHFDSVILNPYYSNRIKEKVVCVLDDYVTNGISFEAARNLLLKAGAKKVILLALGRFRRGNQGVYQNEIYDINGDVSEIGYQYQFISRGNLVGNYDNGARDEVNRIFRILYG